MSQPERKYVKTKAEVREFQSKNPEWCRSPSILFSNFGKIDLYLVTEGLLAKDLYWCYRANGSKTINYETCHRLNPVSFEDVI